MSRFKQIVGIAALGMVVASTALAKGVLYDCDINQRDKRVDWVSPRLVVIVPENGAVSVIDGAILHFKGKPIPARLRDTKNKLKVRWSLQSIKDSRNTNIPNFAYSAQISKSTNKVRVTAKALGFDQIWSGSGNCTLRDDSSLPKNLSGSS